MSREIAIQTLLDAAVRGDLASVGEALDRHSDLVNERAFLTNHTGRRTALHFATGGRHTTVVQLLLERGADPNLRCDGDNATPLHFAAENGDLAIVRLLLEHGADPIGHGDLHELEVIGWATCFGSSDPTLIETLLAHGAEHNVASAVATGEIAALRRLAARSRADLDRPMDATNHRRRPLHLAVVKRQPESLRVLLELGAPTGSLDAAGLTPLDQAALACEAEMVEALLAHGSEVRLPAALALERTSDVERLLAAEPDSLQPGGRWGTLIVRAAEAAPGRVVESLLRHGASVAARDDTATSVDGTAGYTPLHAAAFRGNAEAVDVLLAHGADPTLREEKYRSAPDGWARYAGHIELAERILGAAARPAT